MDEGSVPMVDRTRLLVFVVLGKTLIASRRYDPRGAFVLLHSMEEELHPSLSEVSARAMQANMAAALGGDRQAHDRARAALADVVAAVRRPGRPLGGPPDVDRSTRPRGTASP